MIESRSFADTVETVEQYIDIAVRRGDGPGLRNLRRRAGRILDPPKPPRTALEVERASIDLEHEYWVTAIIDLLTPAQSDAVAAALWIDRGDEDADLITEDPWALLDPHTRRARERLRVADTLRAERAAIAACRRYEQTRRPSHLRVAVVELESSVRAQRGYFVFGLSRADCGEQADRLGRALRQELLPSVFRFFATTVRDAIARHLAETIPTSPARSSGPEQWLSREIWTARSDENRAAGVWFVDWLQEEYDTEMERDRQAEEAEELRKSEADEKLRQWQAARDEEARIDRTEEVSPEPDPPTERSEPAISSDQERERAVEFTETQIPELDDSDYVAWPAHVEDAARYKEEMLQKRIAEDEEFRQAREQQASKEAERLRIEAAKEEAEKAFQAKAARKASPDRIQSNW